MSLNYREGCQIWPPFVLEIILIDSLDYTYKGLQNEIENNVFF